MQWISLNTLDQLNEIDRISNERPVLVFKHSTRCMISGMVLNRMERAWRDHNTGELPIYFLDLLRYRPLSNAVEDRYNVEHASPQVLMIRNGTCVHTASHLGIDHAELIDLMS